MGGKTKQTQRTKNNAKPSNSGRSAELLGASVPSFVGFSAHSDLGMVPFAPGFGTTENLPDTFDSTIGTQFQLILRKMSKKDPITKAKALQEFIDLLTESEVDIVKGLLPLWPKFYHNLANDVDHRVREGAQNVQSLIVSKCKKAVAPFLKQLVPVWLSSQFDNYPPAASVAVASFQSVFAANKTQEVCLFCQQEILDYVVRNLTFHTASTLTSAKSCTPEEAEHKYQQVVSSSLKTMSFFLDKTAGSDISQSIEKIHGLLTQQKFWSFSKHKTVHIKSAWFELLYNVLQYTPDLTKEIKGQFIPLCFQNIDESDPLIVPHVWGCVLLLQSTYEDWYKSVNFKKNVHSKLSTFLRNACSGNAETVCPNLLPLLSKITQESLQDIPLDEFYKSFFSDVKEAILSPKTVAKSDVSSLTSAYYECLRFILQKLSTRTPPEDAEPSLLPQYILDQFIIHPIILSCHSQGVAAKYIFLHTSTLIAYWSQNSETEIYSQMLNGFWSALTTDVESSTLCKPYLDSAIDLVTCLYTANPNLQSQKVKFSTNDDEDTTDGGSRLKSKPTPAYVQTDLRKLVVLLVRLCLDSVSEDMILHYETQIHSLIKLYGDAKFYAQISGKNDMAVTLTSLANILSCATSEPSEVMVEIVFEILNYMDKDKKLQFIDKLLETKKPALQQCLLQRLLSYPMCVEPEVRVMLSQDHVIDIILQTANEVLEDDSKEKFNLLHKCFFQTDSGDILINQKTVDGLLDILSKPLTNPDEFDGMTDPCGSFIAQIMPVVCSNSSEKAQKDIFLKLFRFTIDQKKSDDLSEDTLWEITTCWQDALSSEDIIMDDALLQNCAEVISNRLSTSITPSDIDNMADIMSKLILCSTENIEDEEKRYERIDLYDEVLFKPVCEGFDKSYESVAMFCSFIEAVRGSLSLVQLADDAGQDADLDLFFRRSLLNLSTILKCCVKVNLLTKLENQPTDDEECTEDYFDASESLLKRWTDAMCQLTLQLVKVAALADSLVVNWHKVTDDLQAIMLEISEKAKLLLRSIDEERVMQLKSKLLLDAAFGDVAATRAVPYLVVIPQYSQFQENALILVLEDMTDYFIARKSLGNYVNLLQFVLPDITDRVINADNPVVKGDADSWQKCAVFRCLIDNNFSGETNNISDRSIIAMVLDYITAVSENQKQINKEELLYNTDVTKQDFIRVTRAVEYINLLTQVLTKFPYELTIKNWDAIRLGLSSWLLSVSKSMQDYKNSKVAIFVSAVYSLHAALALFIKSEKEKSSTETLTNMIDEWETLFSPEINIVLFKSFYSFVSLNEPKENSTCFETILQRIEKSIRCLDYSTIFKFCKTGKQIPLDDLTKFVLQHMSSSVFSLRITAAEILNQLTPFFIACDMDTFEKTSDIVDGKARESNWHFMSKFKDQMQKHEGAILKYLDEFTFKLIELPEMKQIDRSDAISYMFLWEYVINVCAKAPVELRSVYTSWLTENKFDQNFLNFLFRAMPVEILKNHDSKLMSNELFKGLDRTHSESEKLAIDKYACHLYAMALSKLPAVVRKWWNGSHSRQKVFVDKLTTNFVSGLICYNELESIAKINMKEKHNNMQVTVHTSTREVNAVYFIDEARMELIITLAPNYPLGGVKVESGKQIGGRASSRNIAMQLTIFLTHQNGSIFDGLSLWKKNLDKKFEGVEECYVCYTVIHQDTCQLPKLTCKTCRKKFHSPCLYKWFTTSSKSTCPICRNIF